MESTGHSAILRRPRCVALYQPAYFLTMIDLCSAQLVLLFVEELLDSQPISSCRTVFSFLESRRETIIAVGVDQMLKFEC